MPAVVTIDTDQRRVRLARRHHLARPTRSVDAAVTDLCGLHSSDPASVFLAARARVRGFTSPKLEHALYDARSLVRMLGMRRTMFVVDRAGAAVMDAACTKALVAGERRRLVKLLEDQEIARDGARWLRRVEQRTLEAMTELGEPTAAELSRVVPELQRKLRMGEGKTWAASVGVSTRVLFLLATEGRVVRGRPNGGWTSSQYRWAPTASWIGELPAQPAVEARAALTRRWLTAFGPGTATDLAWWTGWGQRVTRAALDQVGAVEVDLAPGTGYVLADDIATVRSPGHWVALLPALDSTVMGWKERDWFLEPAHAARLFDRNGNAGPTVWSDGRVIGGWGQQLDGGIAFELLEPVDRLVRDAVARDARALETWLDGRVVTPRFRTPLERELRDL